MSLILGTMNINYPHSSNTNTNLDTYQTIIQTYINECKKDSILDTAYYYGNTSTESILGNILPNLSYQPKIATKVNPWYNNDFTNNQLGQLNESGIIRQLTTSLNNLNCKKVDTMFLHCYDYETPLEITLNTCDTLWRKEKFDHFGISNFSLNQINNTLKLIYNNFSLPLNYYQGMYNLVSRKVEEIFPLLNDHQIDFWAYNPLAGGLLTGKYNNNIFCDSIQENSRFKNNSIYQNIFWKPKLNQDLNDFFIKNHISNPTAYSLQWLKSNSLLKSTDKIVMGVSTVEQLNYNIEYWKQQSILELYNYKSEYSPNYFY